MSNLTTLLKSETPTYEISLPISGLEVSYRPFRVKEEKILLLALEEGSELGMLRGTKRLIESCCDEVEDAGNLPMVELEYLFLNIRAKSVSETLTPSFKCPTTKESISVKINIDKIKIQKPKANSTKIKITEKVGMTMKYPTINILLKNKITNVDNMTTEQTMDLIVDCIDEVWTEDEVFKGEETVKNDMREFVESIPSKKFEVIMGFFTDAPKLQHIVKYKTKDQKERSIKLEGFDSFFE